MSGAEGDSAPRFVWVDGKLRAAVDPVVRADDGAFQAGLGCYTTGRFEAGRLRYGLRVAERLVRDAARLGLPDVDADFVQRGLLELARACFENADGIVRMQASADAGGALHLVATARGFGNDPGTWRVRAAPWHHEGPGPMSGVKLSGHPLLGLVRRWLRQEGDAEEALFFDADDLLVEGSRSTPVLCTADGSFATPPLNRGGVAGVARAIACEGVGELREVDISRNEVGSARELVMLNSVRGARAVSHVDGRPLSETGGALYRRLAEALAQEA